MVNVDENPLLRERYSSAGRPGMRAKRVVVAGAAGVWARTSYGSLAERELGPDHIRVNAVSPGSMLIPGRRWDRMRREDPQAYDAFVGAELPSGAPVTPHEVARTVVFLLSDWAAGVSGAHLTVDRAQNVPSPDGY
ncbi:SDR family oxidoreductase [Streptomyces sp. NPDC057474]|uniref:SDR family oxidoreductase n=1 Tax=Streptomyces sp. NPDC057474 TaxID=3346144 RepID=UPI0036A67EC6